MKKFKVQSAPKIIPLTLSVAIISVMMCLTITAWDPPSQTPPGNNAKAPINVGDAPQGKLGNLGIGTASPGAKLDIADNGTAAGAQFLRVGDDAFLTDIDIAHTLGIYSQGDSTIASIKLGSNGGIISGRNNNIGIGTTSPTEKLELSSGSNIKFTDNGMIKSMDNNHALLFRRSENKIELREYGEIVFSPGATAGTETAKVVIKSNGAVGIGTATPGATLDVYGDIISDGSNAWIFHTPDDGRRTIYIAPGVNGSNFDWTKSFRIDGNNGNVLAQGELQSTMGSGLAQLRMVAGNYGAMLRNDSVNTYFLLTNSGDQYGGWNGLRPLYINNTSGDVTVGTRICLGGKCCSTWEECFSGVTPTPPPGAGNKRIFVTSIAYDSNQLFDRTRADQICQKHAKNLGGTYKALIYYCTTNATPYVALPAGARFWNCSTTDCFEVAENPMDFFTKNTGDDNYLKNPIKYDETGAASASPVAVWTGFTPDGSGGWTGQLCSPTGTPQGLCFSPKGTTAYTIYGSNFSKDIGWAHFATAAYSNPSVCLSQSRALYCVEQ